MNALKQKTIINQFYKTRIENDQNKYLHPVYQLEQKLLTAIEQGNSRVALSTLKELNQLEDKLKNGNIRTLRNSLISSCTLFSRATIKGGVHPDIAFQLCQSFIEEIERKETESELRMLEAEMVHAFIQTLTHKQEITYTGIVNKAITYIHENILQELSLDKIASELYVNPSYLSNIFKKETGITITEYINRKRIEESKYFLLHSDLSISEIAILFHFCNQSYYTLLFKKITDLTPRKFREIETERIFSEPSYPQFI